MLWHLINSPLSQPDSHELSQNGEKNANIAHAMMPALAYRWHHSLLSKQTIASSW